ncbi:hypothetical protein ACHAWF_012227 [Thalassiosira exigua]
MASPSFYLPGPSPPSPSATAARVRPPVPRHDGPSSPSRGGPSPSVLAATSPAAAVRDPNLDLSHLSSSLLSDDGSRQGSLYNVCDDGVPRDDDGRVHHLSVRKGDVANRIVSVGDPARAAALAAWFDGADGGEASATESEKGPAVRRIDSHRPGAFTTLTGTYRGVPVTVVATGMGRPNADFVVRECRAVADDGPMAIVRFGSCGIVDPETKPGCVCVASGSIAVARDPDAWGPPSEEGEGSQKAPTPKYRFSRPIASHSGLSESLRRSLADGIGPERTRVGANATADSFYSSQGRPSPHFDDDNATLLDELRSHPADIVTCEMETFHFLDLARCATKFPMAAGAAVICVASRSTGEVLETSTVRELEREAGRAVLEAIVSFDLDSI